MTREALLAGLEALFKVLFTYDCVGEENVPATGGALVCANHPSYLDPILLSLQVKRPIRFMAWDALFRLPVIGWLVRLFGAFPVDTRRARGGAAYESAKALLEDGELVGIFPEGKRSRSGWMEEDLRAGAARLETLGRAGSLEGALALADELEAEYESVKPHVQALPSRHPARSGGAAQA